MSPTPPPLTPSVFENAKLSPARKTKTLARPRSKAHTDKASSKYK